MHDQARRVLHVRGIDIRPTRQPSNGGVDSNDDNDDDDDDEDAVNDVLTNQTDDYEMLMRCGGEIAAARAAASCAMQMELDKEVTSRIAEAFTCRVCMDSPIDTAFSPCGHVACCDDCAEK